MYREIRYKNNKKNLNFIGGDGKIRNVKEGDDSLHIPADDTSIVNNLLETHKIDNNTQFSESTNTQITSDAANQNIQNPNKINLSSSKKKFMQTIKDFVNRILNKIKLLVFKLKIKIHNLFSKKN